MNIFVLDNDPATAAQAQCDRHVVKMVLESAQLMSGCYVEPPSFSIYKKTHLNHPCAVWARSSAENFAWLGQHALALAAEYTYRYGKKHASEDLLRKMVESPPDLRSAGLTPFAQAMPDEYRSPNTVEAYRRYYVGGKRAIASWKKTRSAPEWWPKET